MQHNYTTTRIIRYIYNELPALEYLETEYAIEHNPEWKRIYSRMKDALSALPRIQFRPRHSSVRSILKYAETV